MPSRTISFVNGEFYHIFNRGVAKMRIFNNSADYKRFTQVMQYYQTDGIKPKFSIFNPKLHILNKDKKIVAIICYCLMRNHFHLLLQQTRDNGITEFVSKVTNSYTRYYNTKYERVGPLFQGEFKAVHIEDNEQLLHLSRYIHLNPLVGYITKDLDHYQWSSYHEYINNTYIDICSKEIILSQFKSSQAYKQFILDQEGYGKQLEAIKHKLLEDPQV